MEGPTSLNPLSVAERRLAALNPILQTIRMKSGNRIDGLIRRRTRWALALLCFFALAAILTSPLGAEQDVTGIPLKGVTLKAGQLVADEAIYNFLRPLAEADTLELPGGTVGVTVQKTKATLTWAGKPRGQKIALSARGKTLKLSKLGAEGEDFRILLLTHPRFRAPFVVNAQALQAKLGGITATFVDADLDGTCATLGKDLVILSRDRMVWALPVMKSLPLGPHFGEATIAGDPPRLQIESAPWIPRIEYREALATLNVQRLLIGTGECVLDQELSEACVKHCNYMKRNGIQAGQGKTHDEDPNLPGFTEEGRRAARNSANSSENRPMPDHVIRFLGTFFHRMGPIRPSTHRLGMAHEHGYNMLDSSSGARDVPWEPPQICPAPGQYDVPLGFVNEWPNPIPGGGQVAGYPITLAFVNGTKGFTELEATLSEGADERAVRVAVSTPDQPSHKARAHNYSSILVLPLKRLLSFEVYRVRVFYRLAGKEGRHDFTFRTGDRTGDRTWGQTWRRMR